MKQKLFFFHKVIVGRTHESIFLTSFMVLISRLSALSFENNKLMTGMIPTQYALKTDVTKSGISPFARLLLGGTTCSDPSRFL
jgi:hypothetical protein